MNTPRDGSPDHPYSALNLRLALALFGVLSTAVIAVLAWAYDYHAIAVVAAVIAVVALVNALVVEVRRMARHRAEGDGHHTLFE